MPRVAGVNWRRHGRKPRGGCGPCRQPEGQAGCRPLDRCTPRCSAAEAGRRSSWTKLNQGMLQGTAKQLVRLEAGAERSENTPVERSEAGASRCTTGERTNGWALCRGGGCRQPAGQAAVRLNICPVDFLTLALTLNQGCGVQNQKLFIDGIFDGIFFLKIF